ncbi:MAG: UvrD-helicase domain-containing protein [Phycisphaerae bacterium]|nr:UvrD-helicase domain-containing protein [Phycisphaerae bacterium]
MGEGTPNRDTLRFGDPELPELTASQRQAAIERAGDSLALTSGAGCGKTLVLARRFTELVMSAGGEDGKNPFDRFVALTFTDKAASEMVRRVRAVLLEMLHKSRSEADRQKIADWIIELPAAHISTIHSFCASLLRRYAVEAGIDPGFTVCADELLAGQMLARSVQDAILAAVERSDAGVLELLGWAEMGRLVDDVRVLLKRRISWGDEDYSDPEKTLARWRRRQEQSRRAELTRIAEDEKLRDELNYLAAYPCDEPTDKLLIYREEKLAVIAGIMTKPESVPHEQIAALTKKAGNVGGHKTWGGKDALVAYRRRLATFVAQFAVLGDYYQSMGDADADAANCLSVLTKLARLADDIYTRQKRSAGMLDFDDLIDLTARLLRDNTPVRKGVRDRLGQLLIDECQDTDATQLRMLLGLLDGDDEGDAPRPGGKVCIIGDVKQSIYRFRGAQAEVFERLCDRFGSARVLLNETFRTHRAGVAFVNSLFDEMMDNYEPIVSSRMELPAGPSVEILLAESDDDADSAADAQAELVAQRIAEMINSGEKRVFDRAANGWRPVRPGDVAILFARMTTSLRYEYALQRRSLPYYVVAGVGFFQQQEVYDVLNALRVIDNTFDDVALFGLLRSAVFGLDDNVLLHIASSAEPPYFDGITDPSVLARLTAQQAEQLCFAHEMLGRLHRAKDALGPAAVAERLLEQTGYPAVLLSQFHGRRKLGNVHRLLEAARTSQATGRITLSDFIRQYSEFIAGEARYEQASVAGENDDVIRIMTIHKAKGLEFPIVIIPDLNVGRHKIRDRILFHPDWSVTCNPPGSADENDDEDGQAGKEPVSFRLSKQAERRAARDEDVRRLYVAATRHRDHLIFVGADRRSKDGRFKDSGCYLSALDDVFGIADAIDAGADRIEYGEGFIARLSRIEPSRPPVRRRHQPPGLRIISTGASAGKVAEALAATGRDCQAAELNLVGPLPVSAARATVSATALADFGHCPMLYRWRHELRVPLTGKKTTSAMETHLDAATAGTLLHRCMEMVDFDDIASVQAETLVGRAVTEMELTVPTGPLGRELADMLERLAKRPLLRKLTEAKQRLTELSFVYRDGVIDITGQIDLLYRDAAGAWHVVDYKSDRIGPGEVEAHAKRYELQMMIYLAAAGRGLDGSVSDATVYFLRAGVSHRFAATSETIAGAENRLTDLAAELVRCRRAGQFPRIGETDVLLCKTCPYAGLCLRGNAVDT